MINFPNKIEIAGRQIGADCPCYIIAEGGVAHFGSLDKAKRLVDLAVDANADVFKSQHFDTELLINKSSPEWRERLKTKQLSDEQIIEIQKYCHVSKIPFLCTPHEIKALTFLNEIIDIPAFKVGSGELQNWEFLEQVARKEKPIILSTGMHTIQDIKDAISVLSDHGCKELAILHCVTSYPTKVENINLRVMEKIRSFFNGPVGYSDHTEGMSVSFAAAALGADIIEKHITIDVNVKNAQDWKVSCDTSNFAQFVKQIREIETCLGDGIKKISHSEKESIKWARKSLVYIQDIQIDTKIHNGLIFAQRPGTGISPSYKNSIIGKTLKKDVMSGDIVCLDDFYD